MATKLTIWGMALCCCAAPSVLAGHITMQISATPTVRDNHLQCTVGIINQGDESAANVQIHLDFQGQRHSSPSQALLAVQQKHSADFSLPIIGLPTGRHPVAIIVDYTDTNGYPFTALSYADFVVGEDYAPKIHGVIDGIELGKQARMDLRIKNLDDTPRELKLRLILPKELSSTQNQTQISLKGNEEQTVRFPVSNFSALEGSSYQVYVQIEYDEKGKHSCLSTPGTIKIVAAQDIFKTYRLLLIVGMAALVIVFIALQFIFRQRGSKNHHKNPSVL